MPRPFITPDPWGKVPPAGKEKMNASKEFAGPIPRAHMGVSTYDRCHPLVSSQVEVAGVSTEEALDPQAMQDAVLGPLVRVVEEAAGGDPWALVGATACRLQGANTPSPNLEFVTTEPALRTLAAMLDMPSTWGRGAYLAAQRLHFMRGHVPVFVFANPVFHGSYEALSPMEVPSLWDARQHIEVDGATVLATPL